MKLTPEQLAEIERGHIGKRFGENEFTYPRLFDHIRAVEKERNDWRDMATRLATKCKCVDTLARGSLLHNEGPMTDRLLPIHSQTLQNIRNLIADYDALVAREVEGKPKARTWKAFAAITNGRLGDVRERASALVAYPNDERIAVTVTEVVG